MTILKSLVDFRNEEDGAVTVDWVVLTAAVVGLGVAVLGSVYTGMDTASTTVSDGVKGDYIKTDFN